MNTAQLSCFAEVASTLSFSKAANNLHVSQPTVSHQVRTLEDELGCELLVRSTRSVALTDKGLAFLGYAHDILEMTARAKHAVASEDMPTAQRLRIGVNDGIEAQMISPALRTLHRQDADFEPLLRLAPHSALVEMLENGTLDVVLEYRDPAGAPASATVFRRLFEAPAALVCSSDHPLASAAPDVLPTDACLGAEKVAFGNPRTMPPAIVALQRELMRELDPRKAMMCPNVEVVLSVVSAGMAVAALPDVPAMHRPDLAFVRLEGLDPVVMGVRVHRGRPSRLVERFTAALADALQTEQW